MKQTKQKILTVALELFSKKGYSAVSIRDICNRVGIKESTVYYHFKNKQEIFDSLQAQFVAIAEHYTVLLSDKLGGGTSDLDNSFFEKVGSVYIEQFLLDDFCSAFLRTLNIERMHDEQAAQLYEQWLFAAPLKFQAEIFSCLMRIGMLPPQDGNDLAVRYYAPVFLFYQRYILSGEMTEEKKAQFRRHTYRHFEAFMKDGEGRTEE